MILVLANAILSCSNNGSDNSLFGQDVKPEKIVKLIESGKSVYMEDCVITGDIDFTKIEKLLAENVNVRCNYVQKQICFVNCTFNVNVIFSVINADGKFVKSIFEAGVT